MTDKEVIKQALEALYSEDVDQQSWAKTALMKALAQPVQPMALEIARLNALSVTNILIEITPGDGSGLEVYAKSVADVEHLLTEMGGNLEYAQGELQTLRTQLATLEAALAQPVQPSTKMENFLAIIRTSVERGEFTMDEILARLYSDVQQAQPRGSRWSI